ncbi:organic cation transporter protein-like [Diadema antillarum]|uniref:organic cation transporter protein-like n=1 Tax=Diadema antillarum TaxID=105358 RepID=UPI003A84BBBB
MRFDDILTAIGEFGRYQILIFFAVFIMMIPCGFHAIGIVFLGGSADHWCSVPQWEAKNCTSFQLDPTACAQAKRHASIPPADPNNTEVKGYSQCKMYNVSGLTFSSLVDLDQENWTTTAPFSNDPVKSDVIPCSSGWIFDTSRYKSTINMEFDLVCDRKDLSDISASMWFVGILIGSFVFGSLADRIGRCRTLWICLAIQLLFGISVAFAPTFWSFVVLRMIVGSANMGVYMMCFIIGTEFVGPSKRVLAGQGINFAFSVGYMGLSVLAYLLRDWHHLQLAISVPIAAFFLFVPIVPESARWLLSQGEIERASEIIRSIARGNRATLAEPIFTESDRLEMEKQHDGKKSNILDLFRTPNLRMESINLAFNWLVENLVYYGLSLGAGDLGVNVYLAAFVSGAVELPAYASTLFTLEYYGRRISTCLYLLIAGGACLLTIVIPSGPWKAAVATIGKFGVTASFGIIFIYTAELYPTPVRSVGLGMCSMSSRVGAIIAPLIRILGRTWAPLPSLVYGLSSIAAGLLALLLPETRGRKLPETMEEGENLRNAGVHYAEVPAVDAEEKPANPMSIPMNDETTHGDESDKV